MTTLVSLTVGVIVPGRAPVFTSRTVPYTDLSVPLTIVSSILTTPPFVQYLPVPLPPEEPIVEDPLPE